MDEPLVPSAPQEQVEQISIEATMAQLATELDKKNSQMRSVKKQITEMIKGDVAYAESVKAAQKATKDKRLIKAQLEASSPDLQALNRSLEDVKADIDILKHSLQEYALQYYKENGSTMFNDGRGERKFRISVHMSPGQMKLI